MPAINQFCPGQKNAPALLFHRLQSKRIDLLTFSSPNANLQEHYVLFEYLRHHQSSNFLILPVVFNDLRETGLHPDIAVALQDNQIVSVLTNDNELVSRFSNKIAFNRNLLLIVTSLVFIRRLRNSQKQILNSWLAENFPLWELRSEVPLPFSSNSFFYAILSLGSHRNQNAAMIQSCYPR